MPKFYQVTNLVKPHCTRCSKSYRIGDNLTICKEFYGKGKERIQCGGPVVKDLQLLWSKNLVKDYSVLTVGDLSIFDEAEQVIKGKLDAVKIGKSADSGRAKVNVQQEYENFMRLRGVNIVNRFNSFGELESISMYILPAGKARVSEYGYEELKDRFEQREYGEGEQKTTDGFLVFEEEGNPKKEKLITLKDVSVDDLTCKVCGKTFKGKLGLIAHSKTHNK